MSSYEYVHIKRAINYLLCVAYLSLSSNLFSCFVFPMHNYLSVCGGGGSGGNNNDNINYSNSDNTSNTSNNNNNNRIIRRTITI